MFGLRLILTEDECHRESDSMVNRKGILTLPPAYASGMSDHLKRVQCRAGSPSTFYVTKENKHSSPSEVFTLLFFF